MKKKESRLLIIDASVAQSAGETNHPTSSACREFLSAVLTICHRAVITGEMRKEWNKHQSRYTRKWQRSMVARKKIRYDIKPDILSLNLDSFEQKQRESVEKDLLLLEAAFAADREIVTRDNALFLALGSTSEGQRLRKQITWHNPESDGTAKL